MTKEELMALGLTEEQANKVIASHADTIKNKFVPLDRFNEKATELQTAKDTIAERDTQIKDLSKFEGDNAALKTKLQELENTNKESATKHEQDLKSERVKNAVKFSLTQGDKVPQEGAMDIVLGSLDLSKVEINDKGEIVGGFKEQYENAVKGQSFLFTDKKAADSQTNPGFSIKGLTQASEGTGDQTKEVTVAQFGQSLAQQKLSQLGVKPQTSETK